MDYDKEDSTLEFRNICLTLKDKDVLKNVSGSAEPGKLLALMGPSGEIIQNIPVKSHIRIYTVIFLTLGRTWL